LLRILTGQEQPDAGSVNWARGAKVGYLRQEQAVDSGRTVLEEAQSAVHEQLVLQARLQELEAAMEKGASEEDLEEYARLHEHFAEAEGYALDRSVTSVLTRMGFDEADFDRPTTTLSGGQKTRLALARLLLEEPDLLILDEPTNHLDLQATEWLEGWIRQYRGAVLLVSHDRTFLENTAQRVIEMRAGTCKSYPGDFRKFLQLRAEEEERQAEVAMRQAAEIAKLDEFVRRFMNSQRTAQARGRLKMKEKLEATKIEAPKGDKGIKAGFGKVARSGDLVIECKGLAIGYPGVTLFKGLDWTVRWGERWAVIGENGAGKSTLAKTLLGDLPSISGTSRLGTGLTVGYFTQDAQDLDPDSTPLEHMVWECGMDPGPARDLLGRFLLSGDDVLRPIRTLSGGEKNKLVLATLTTLAPNLLVLDEPTNHLDMDSRDALAQILREFGGTLVLISHDRWLINQVTNHTLDVRRAGPIVYPGPYEDYRRKLEAPVVVSKTVVAPTKVSTLSQREVSKEIGRVSRMIESTEDEIARCEDALRHVEENLSNPPEGADLLELTTKHASIQSEIERLMAEWTNQSAELDDLRSMQGS
ncbi:MAG: ABC-F family ATP-binding cassette domain-containing protein, partial [Armatimonadota bacterium]